MGEQTTLKQAAIVFFRILSAYVFLTVLHYLGYWSVTDKTALIAVSLMIILALMVSFTVWRLAPILSDRLLKIDEQELDSRGIAILALRVVGLYFVFTQIPWTIIRLVQAVIGSFEWFRFSYPARYIVAGLITWRFSKLLGARIVRGLGKAQRSPTSIVVEKDLQAVAFSVVGAFLLIQAIPSLINLIRDLFIYDSSLNAWQIGTRILQIFIGVALVIGTKRLSDMIQRFREYGLDISGEDAQASE